jgi:tetratricopeptide (TPR) repeat protein
MLRLTLLTRLALAVILWLSLRTAGAQAEGPSSGADAKAQHLFEQGALAYDEGRFAEALASFEQAYELSARPKLLFNIGRAADSDGQAQRAIDAYNAYLLEFPQAENRLFVESRITKLSSALPPTPATVQVQIPSPREAASPPRTSLRLPIWLMVGGAGSFALGTGLLIDSLANDPSFVGPSIFLMTAGSALIVTGAIVLRARRRRARAAKLQQVSMLGVNTTVAPLLPSRSGGPVGLQARLTF